MRIKAIPLISFAFLALTLFLPISGSALRSVKGGDHWRNDHPRYDERRFVDPNYYYTESYGNVPEAISPAPPPDSQPGMSDDSDALYRSYLKANKK